MNGPLVSAWDRSVPVDGAQKGHATKYVEIPSLMALDANGIWVRVGVLNPISITE